VNEFIYDVSRNYLLT